jgi:hypothetical protein
MDRTGPTHMGGLEGKYKRKKQECDGRLGGAACYACRSSVLRTQKNVVTDTAQQRKVIAIALGRANGPRPVHRTLRLLV